MRRDLAANGTVEALVRRANTVAWVCDDDLVYDAQGNPASFRAWCRFGGLALDPAWWRATLLAGSRPATLVYEDQ